jgi:hypothetical protein
MQVRAIIGAGTVAVLAAAGAVMIPLAASAQPAGSAAGAPAPAGASPKVHTYKFVSVTEKQINFSKTSVGFADTDVNAKGKITGFDVVSGTANPKTGNETGYLTIDVPGGLIYATAHGNFASPTMKGAVTGGAGAFTHAKGTIVVKNLNASGSKAAVTISYTI